MNESSDKGTGRADVLIVGAGPNGLMLAAELCLAGVKPVVLEQLAERSREPKANGMVGQVVRFLDHRGLYEPLSGTKGAPAPAPWFMFGALPLELGRLADNPMYVLPVPQREVEAFLENRARELGAEIRRGHALRGLTQDEDQVTAEIESPDGTYRIGARYLVGCDGAHSQVRRLAGIGFPGTTTVDTVSRTAHVSLPPEMVRRESGELDVPGFGRIPVTRYLRTEHGVFVCALFDPARPVLTTMEWGGGEADDEPMTIEELRASVHRVLGVDVPMAAPAGPGPHLLRRLTGRNTRIAEKYRSGRVFLAGDAAHTHSAAGGPGLNLGLQDVANLGWKLGVVLRGWVPPEFLDTYQEERYPVAERVVVHSQAQQALLAPGAEVTALRQIFGELLDDDPALRRIAETMAGSDVRYPMPGSHPLIGRFVPDFVLDNGSRVAELLRDARPLLVDLTGDGRVAERARDWQYRVRLVTGSCATAPAAALLVRPDGYVAWATDDVHNGLEDALTTWFGLADAEVAVGVAK